MDSNDLERERGITILAKFTAITWKGTRINIVDTPGPRRLRRRGRARAQDGRLGLPAGRRLRGPDAADALRDAQGAGAGAAPDPGRQQDRPRRLRSARGTVDATFDLFCALGATDAQLDFPIVYASGREGWAVKDLKDDEHKDLGPLLDLIVEKVPPPTGGDIDAARWPCT